MAVRSRVVVSGVVQGVGFRPFVYRLATQLGLTGWVANTAAGVVVEVEGDPRAIDELCRKLRQDPPPLARVHGLTRGDVPPRGEDGFRIVASGDHGTVRVAVAVDTAPCEACLRELEDPLDRRFRYPFINCTDCGPRYTIIRRLPYDRPHTTMAGFGMCEACAREYHDPADRRFHAQPNACPDCGPHLWLRAPGGPVVAERDAALQDTIGRLQAGQVVAVKGVGGYHLACRADDPTAVTRLRQRKRRDDKPFAVLVADLDTARRLAELTDADARALTAASRPIALVPRRSDADLAAGVAPGLADIGLMLPPSPLHHLLARQVAVPLVLTSGNVAHEPIAHRDDDASDRLAPLVDGILGHNRPIHIRCDDSVVRAMPGGPIVTRRSRGLAPTPVTLPGGAGPAVLAVGAHLKNTVTVTRDDVAYVSHHIGDLDHPAAHQAFHQAIDHLLKLYRITPEVVAHDLHPDYHATQFAHELDLPLVPVQHHHAHIASCLVEHGREAPVLGIAFDGLGLGTDGVLWGGEFLIADLRDFTRVGHLCEVPQPGGDAATREPWRMATAWLAATMGPDVAAREASGLDPRASDLVAVLDSPLTPRTTSIGRLFDAVAALVGLVHHVTYEGQAAMLLEAAAAPVDPASVATDVPTCSIGAEVLDARPLVAAVREWLAEGRSVPDVAARFHAALAADVSTLAADLARRHGMDTVALSGGVFQNRRLATLLQSRLRDNGLTVLTHRAVPCNDGGLSLGQAAIARVRRSATVIARPV